MADAANTMPEGALAQDLTLIAYMLRRHGWTITVEKHDRHGAQIAAHKDAPRVIFSDAANLKDLEE